MSLLRYLILSAILLLSSILHAQDVIIDVPAIRIADRAEFSIVKTVMNAPGTSWRTGLLSSIDPAIKAQSVNLFRHSTSPMLTLPSEVLWWQLANISGRTPLFSRGDVWPGFKSFTTSYQTWYQPTRFFGTRPSGDVNFTFKIPADQWANHKFVAGNYRMDVMQNYGPAFNPVEFSPEIFKVVLSIPPAVAFTSSNISKYVTIGNLNIFRNTSNITFFDLDNYDIFHTVDLHVRVKAAAPGLQFTPTKGPVKTKPISMIQIQGGQTASAPLSLTWKNLHAGNNSYEVTNGNRSHLPLKLGLSAEDFINNFFEAGTYHFQLNFEARSTDNTLSSQQNTEVTLKVPPLSEISIPAASSVVNFDFNTAAQYEQGQSQTVINQLSISNNENYELYVKADAPYFKKNGVQTDIPSSILKIATQESRASVNLSATSQKIINNGAPVLDKKVDIDYTIPAGAARSLLSKEKNTYSINIIYSFTSL